MARNKENRVGKRTEVPVTEDAACGVFYIHRVGRHITAEECVDRTLRFRQKALGHIPGLHHGVRVVFIFHNELAKLVIIDVSGTKQPLKMGTGEQKRCL